jgi:hypothetical protein
MNMDINMIKTLGKLEKVNPRDIWKTEDKHFTPWLAQDENISLLVKQLV